MTAHMVKKQASRSSRTSTPSKKPTAAKAAPARKQAGAAASDKPASARDAIQALHEALSAYDHVAARELDLNRSDLACLRFLRAGPRRARAIGAALGLTSGSVTALIDRLEAAKLVKRSVSEADRRAIDVELTPQSLRRLNKAFEPLEKALAGALGAQKKANVDGAQAVATALAAACDELVSGPAGSGR